MSVGLEGGGHGILPVGSVLLHEVHDVRAVSGVHDVGVAGLAGGIEGIHKTVMELEERVLRAFASHDELVDAGFVPGATPRAGRLPTPYAPATGKPTEAGVATSERLARAQETKREERHERTQRIAGNVLQAEVDE